MDPNQPDIDGRYRTILTLWFAISMSILIFVGMAFFIPAAQVGNARVSLMLTCAGIIPLAVSFLLKSQILNKAARQQRLDQVQIAYVLSFALSEMPALLGLLDHFSFGGPFYYVGFILAALSMLLHFPQKKHLLAASGQEF